ncbi:MAG: SAM-dependent methyltransferase [Helicobacteraceae bacterium]|jgi:SAM-dependent MidA family methyltransferase|nr:SAM-dependent methyltransferase [Helicobacteraceae bacterium]
MVRFCDYVREWLYGVEGYYMKAPAIGKRGDFYTSVSVTPFFGGAIANFIIRQIESARLSENAIVIEFGAHDGRLIADVIQFIHTLEPRLLNTLKFAIIEPIAALREKQKRYLSASFGEAIDPLIVPSIKHIEAKTAFIYANELFDAFAFDLIDGEKIAFVGNGVIEWKEADRQTIEKARELGIIRGELFCGYEEFASALKRRFEKIAFMTFDYGEIAPRNDFSARIYAKHKVLPLFELKTLSPYFAQADLSADAPFWHIKQAFLGAGFANAEIKTQNTALLEMGLTDLLNLYQEKAGFETYIKEVGRIRALLDPAQLGEKFKRLLALLD